LPCANKSWLMRTPSNTKVLRESSCWPLKTQNRS
jgi:hypothetical protein